MRAWSDAGYDFGSVAVNLSARQFAQDDLAYTVAGVLDATGLDPRRLELEITEGAVIADPDRAVRTLLDLSAMGVGLSIDDFGTGQSSLAYLKRFHIHCLKIDKAFVNGIPENGSDVAIARAILVLAKSLGLRVVAEGVERESQREFLAAEGCDEVQGFLFGRPLPPAELEVAFGRTAVPVRVPETGVPMAAERQKR